MDISIVIPLLNEGESLHELHDWILKVMNENHYSYEILFIDDGSTDNSWQIIEELTKINPNINGLKFSKNYGKSQALNAGFKRAKGDIIITMDADLQDAPDEIPKLYNKIIKEKHDLVSGWKKKRFDSKIKKNIPSKLFNWAAKKTSGIQLNDFNCGLKAYTKKVIKTIKIQGEMHRYIPVLVKNAGFENIGEQIVKHQSRKYGVTKFGKERFINGFLDLITIWFISKFGRRPMHLFGLLGVLMLIIGFFSTLSIGLTKIMNVFYFHKPYPLITDNPLFYIALTTMILGTQLFLAGFIGELILRDKKSNPNYQISNKVGINP